MKAGWRVALNRGVHAAALLCLAATQAVTTTAGAQTTGVNADATGTAKAGAAVHRQELSERIRLERAAVATERERQEVACYQRVLVEDCLRDVLLQARESEARLRRQEISLNDAERKEKAVERLRLIEEKAKEIAPASASPGMPAKAATAQMPAAVVRNRPAPPDPQAAANQRANEALQRSQEHRQRVKAQATTLATRNTDIAERAAKAQERQARVIKDAQDRRARVEQAEAQARAAGRQSAPPLPTAPTSR